MKNVCVCVWVGMSVLLAAGCSKPKVTEARNSGDSSTNLVNQRTSNQTNTSSDGAKIKPNTPSEDTQQQAEAEERVKRLLQGDPTALLGSKPAPTQNTQDTFTVKGKIPLTGSMTANSKVHVMEITSGVALGLYYTFDIAQDGSFTLYLPKKSALYSTLKDMPENDMNIQLLSRLILVSSLLKDSDSPSAVSGLAGLSEPASTKAILAGLTSLSEAASPTELAYTAFVGVIDPKLTSEDQIRQLTPIALQVTGGPKLNQIPPALFSGTSLDLGTLTLAENSLSASVQSSTVSSTYSQDLASLGTILSSRSNYAQVLVEAPNQWGSVTEWVGPNLETLAGSFSRPQDYVLHGHQIKSMFLYAAVSNAIKGGICETRDKLSLKMNNLSKSPIPSASAILPKNNPTDIYSGIQETDGIKSCTYDDASNMELTNYTNIYGGMTYGSRPELMDKTFFDAAVIKPSVFSSIGSVTLDGPGVSFFYDPQTDLPLTSNNKPKVLVPALQLKMNSSSEITGLALKFYRYDSTNNAYVDVSQSLWVSQISVEYKIYKKRKSNELLPIAAYGTMELKNGLELPKEQMVLEHLSQLMTGNTNAIPVAADTKLKLAGTVTETDEPTNPKLAEISGIRLRYSLGTNSYDFIFPTSNYASKIPGP